MSVSSIPDPVKLRMWAVSGGRCQYHGCNEDLTRDDLTRWQFNAAYLAHIVADVSGGPRGDVNDSPRLAQEQSNIMLLCDKHHRLIDRVDVAGHSVEMLRAMKKECEDRIRKVVLASVPDTKTEIVRYGANIDEQHPQLSMRQAIEAITPEFYSASDVGFPMQMLNSLNRDTDASYYQEQERHLLRAFEQMIGPRLREGTLPKLSVFGLAPQPLLMRLGSLLTEITVCEVFQRHREPQTWKWAVYNGDIEFIFEKLTYGSDPALILALSSTITQDRVLKVLPNAAIWQLTVQTPDKELIKSRHHLECFRNQARQLLDEIKAKEGHGKTLHVFPSMPVSTAIEFGRVRMPKGDMTLRVYDELKDRGFVPALEF